MKKLIYTFVLFFSISVGLLAQNIVTKDLFTNFENQNYLNHKPTTSIPLTDISNSLFEDITKANGNEIQALTYTAIQEDADATFSLMGMVTPLAYEPISGALYYVATTRVFDIPYQNTNYISKGFLFVKRSANMGQTWDSIVVYDVQLQVALMPSIGVHNTTNTQVLNEIPFTVHSKRAEIQGSPPNMSLPWGGGTFSLFWDGAPESIETVSPFNQSGTQQLWNNFKMVPYSGNGKAINYAGGMLASASANDQYGYYGIYGYDLVDQYFNTDIVPQQWWSNKFRAPQGPQSTYNGRMEIAVDPDGNLYALVNNVYVDEPEFTQRRWGVSKSVDEGNTWTDFDRVPESTLNDYMALHNFDQRGSYPYQMDALYAYGEDEYSIFTRISLGNSVDQTSSLHLVEIYHKDNTWSIKKITEIEGVPYMLHNSRRPENTPPTPAWDTLAYYGIHALGNELQVATTADGQNMLLKWIDVVDEVPLNPPAAVSFTDGQSGQLVQGTLDFALMTDIFVCSRSIDGTEWSQPLNVSQDNDAYNKMTWIPSIVPDLENIPVLGQVSFVATNATHYLAKYNVQPLSQIVTNIRQTTTYSLITTSPVDDQPVENKYGFVLHDAYPNPVIENAEFTLSLDSPTHIRLELHNSLGQKVGVIHNGLLSSGTHGITYDTGNLADGIYYYTLTVGSQSLTKTLTVLK